WGQISQGSLYKVRRHAGVESLKIRLSKVKGKPLDIDLAALSPNDKSHLLKRMEREISDCHIQHELAQSMVPKSERSYTEIWLQSLSAAPERKTLDPLEPGQLIADGRYEVLKPLGVGGQGTAYLCHVAGSDKAETVVLKETVLPTFVEDSVR